MASFSTSHIVAGILECDAATKQKLGQRMARHLRLQEGKLGPDEGIDGFAVWGAHRIHFQCKLRSGLIGPDDAKIFWADMIRHRRTDGIYLAGTGFTQAFREVSEQMERRFRELGEPIPSFLLTLADVFDRTSALHEAAKVLPPVASLDAVVAP